MNILKGELDAEEHLGKVTVAFMLAWRRLFRSHGIK